MNDIVLNADLRHAPWLDPNAWRLPGVQPLDPNDWLLVDDAYAGQMRLKDDLIATRESEVHTLLPDARPAAEECLDLVLKTLAEFDGFDVQADQVTRPDGHRVAVERTRPLLTLGRLIQEDVCLMMPGRSGEHVLAGAILCFPASWTLAEKIGKPLVRIHKPVPAYDDNIARRVQRLFDGIRPERPLWRANALLYDHPYLFSPRREAGGPRHLSEDGRFLRSERQTLRKLPDTGAVVFTIHTTVLPIEDLSEAQRDALHLVARASG
jgi:hypothetical protein